MNESLRNENLWNVYAHVNDWIRAADTKAATLLATNGVLVTVLASLMTADKLNLKSHAVTWCLAVLACGLSALSAKYTIACLLPNVDCTDAKSLIFFGTVRARYATKEKYADAAVDIFGDDDKTARQVAHQVYVNSCIATAKHDALKPSVILLALAILTLLIAGLVDSTMYAGGGQ